jgi:hypothetical protein
MLIYKYKNRRSLIIFFQNLKMISISLNLKPKSRFSEMHNWKEMLNLGDLHRQCKCVFELITSSSLSQGKARIFNPSFLWNIQSLKASRNEGKQTNIHKEPGTCG